MLSPCQPRHASLNPALRGRRQPFALAKNTLSLKGPDPQQGCSTRGCGAGGARWSPPCTLRLTQLQLPKVFTLADLEQSSR